MVSAPDGSLESKAHRGICTVNTPYVDWHLVGASRMSGLVLG